MKPKKMLRNIVLQFKVNAEENAIIRAEAQRNGMTVSTYCRWVLTRKGEHTHENQ